MAKTIKENKDIIKFAKSCYHFGMKAHWKRKCKAFLASLNGKKLFETFTSGIFIIEVNMLISFASYILDTEYGSHIYINMQKLDRNLPLQKDEVDLHVENEQG